MKYKIVEYQTTRVSSNQVIKAFLEMEHVTKINNEK